MIEELKRFIEALREELQHYGEMLGLLDRQQELVVIRAADEILQTVSAINAQSVSIQSARQHRQHRIGELARTLRRPDDITCMDLIPLLPDDYRPLVRALVEENNELLMRVQQRARQNHLLLSRSVDLMQRFIATLIPSEKLTRYNEVGTVSTPGLPSRAMYEAVG